MESLNKLVPEIIKLHKRREGMQENEHITKKEVNLIVVCLDIFEKYLFEQEQERIKKEKQKQNNTIPMPEWLTEEIRLKVKQTYNENKTVDDHKRVEAAKILKNEAEKVGYKISYGKALEIIQKYCLTI